MTHIEIARAAAADLDAIAAIERNSFGEDAFSRRQLAYLIQKAKGICLTARCGAAICGYISLLERSRQGNLRIYSVAVAAEARGCGAGQLLLDAAIAYAQQRGLREVSLEVRSTNLAAIGLYTKNGFVQTGILRRYYHDRADAWRMVRPVTAEQ